jgi:hypothetical protein
MVNSNTMKDIYPPQAGTCDDLSFYIQEGSRWRREATNLLALLLFLWASLTIHAQTSMSEYQVKALFLLNFAKYVDWSAAVPPNANAPIIIGILGQDNFNDSLKNAAAGKTVNGRSVVVKQVSSSDDLGGCSILFISSSENSRLDEILSKTSALPILTVGESESFLAKGGIINFLLTDGKIQLAINLKTARKVRLQISSKLLSVAVTVKE